MYTVISIETFCNYTKLALILLVSLSDNWPTLPKLHWLDWVHRGKPLTSAGPAGQVFSF